MLIPCHEGAECGFVQPVAFSVCEENFDRRVGVDHLQPCGALVRETVVQKPHFARVRVPEAEDQIPRGICDRIAGRIPDSPQKNCQQSHKRIASVCPQEQPDGNRIGVDRKSDKSPGCFDPSCVTGDEKPDQTFILSPLFCMFQAKEFPLPREVISGLK